MIKLNKNAPMPESIHKNKGNSNFSLLPEVAVIASLGVYSYDRNELFFKQYPVNKDDLEILEQNASCIVDTCHEALSDIGQLIAHAPKDDCAEVLKSIGWVITALSEIAEYASVQRSDFAYSLEQQSKKSPEK